ncbi:Aminotransferase [Hyphodiscus hymeniophilus]|uniref:Aminotransferase n=1 Tax=Hyphodiscus hymeniophilus TaxID=353542 RepID=A0A9P7AUH9_9HELO|nr:Aminotransferase [Hyphodiscus hymeniophilus]
MVPPTAVELPDHDFIVSKPLPVRRAAPKQKGSTHAYGTEKTEYLMDRNIHKAFPVIIRGKGNYLYTKDGRIILDTTTGAAVSCLGHGDKRVIQAIARQMETGITYLATSFFGNNTVEALCKELINGTDRQMARVYLTGSGSEAMEAAVKLSRQYFYEQDQNTRRVSYIAREGSYHGNTLGALGISGHVARRAPYLPFLMKNVHHVSSCNFYRQRQGRETTDAFVARKAAELDAKFQELGPETVIGFVAEPIVGAALGCVPYVPGYLKAMRKVCHKYGALFILDEVMCGMGRSGTLHAWQAEGVAPDLQTIGKGLGGGYQPIAAVLISKKVFDVFSDGSGQFVHGQTYQGMPIQAAAALEVQKIVREEKLCDNVRIQGDYLGQLLKQLLGNHPNVGDIRGMGLFWGLEFVKDRDTKEPFDPKIGVAQKIQELALSEPHNMTIYPGTGTAGGLSGDHVMLCPAYIVTKEDIHHIAHTTAAVVKEFFSHGL